MKMLRWTILICCLTVVTANSATARCAAVSYKVGQIISDSPNEALLTISIDPRDLAPPQLICLAEALRRRYQNRQTINIFIFSSFIAAKYYTPVDVDRDEPSNINKTKSHFHARDLHAIYTFEAMTGEEYVDLKPEGFESPSSSDMRFKLPATTIPHCRNELSGRCVLIMQSLRYPIEALRSRSSGTVTLTGTIERDGKITRVKAVDATTVPSNGVDAFVREAIGNIATWRLEAASHKDTFRTTYSYILDSSVPRLEVGVQFGLPNLITIRARPLK